MSAIAAKMLSPPPCRALLRRSAASSKSVERHFRFGEGIDGPLDDGSNDGLYDGRNCGSEWFASENLAEWSKRSDDRGSAWTVRILGLICSSDAYSSALLCCGEDDAGGVGR